MWKNLRKGRAFKFWQIIDFFVEILKNCSILALLFYFYYIIMEKIIYTQKIYETPFHVKFTDLARYLNNDAFSLWNDSVKYFEIGERKFFADGKIEEILFSSPKENVVRYLRLHEVRAQQNVKLASLDACGNVLFCDTSFVVMFGQKLPDKPVEKRTFENAAHFAAKKAKHFKFVHIQIIQRFLGSRGRFQKQLRIAVKPDDRLHYDEAVNAEICAKWGKNATPENTLEHFQSILGCF